MIATIKKMLGIGPKADLAEVISRGATILDVRTNAEFVTGHIKGSVNIPVSVLTNQLGKLKKDKPVITCCASGMRSSSARSILLSNGFKEVYNAGSWYNLKQYEK